MSPTSTNVDHTGGGPRHVRNLPLRMDAIAGHDTAHRGDSESDADAETASQRSIPLSSPPRSPRAVTTPLRAQDFFRRDSQVDSIEIDFGSETDDSRSDLDARRASSITSAAPSAVSQPELPKTHAVSVTYPPTSSSDTTDVDSFTSAASTYSRKARPESMLLQPPHGPLVLGIALVDFNHLVRLVGYDIRSSRRYSTRLAPRSNSAKVTFSRTWRLRKCFPSSPFRTELIWCAPSVAHAHEISSCHTVSGRLLLLPSCPRCIEPYHNIWDLVSPCATCQKTCRMCSQM